jgi:hypothetical protein
MKELIRNNGLLVAAVSLIAALSTITFAGQKQAPAPAATGKSADPGKSPVRLPLTAKQTELIKQLEAEAKDMQNRHNAERQRIQGTVQGLLQAFVIGTALEDKPVCQLDQQGQIVNAPCFSYRADEKGAYVLVESVPPEPLPEKSEKPAAPNPGSPNTGPSATAGTASQQQPGKP